VGLLGIKLAATKCPIRRLILNYIGPFTSQAAQKFVRDSLIHDSDGQWRMHYNPEIIPGRK